MDRTLWFSISRLFVFLILYHAIKHKHVILTVTPRTYSPSVSSCLSSTIHSSIVPIHSCVHSFCISRTILGTSWGCKWTKGTPSLPFFEYLLIGLQRTTLWRYSNYYNKYLNCSHLFPPISISTSQCHLSVKRKLKLKSNINL